MDGNQDNAAPLIAIACGGTGGHTFPGIATARVLAGRGCRVLLLAAGREVEKQTLCGWDGEVFATGARHSPMSIPGAVLRSWCEFGRKRPDVLVAMGSYTSIPPAIAARLRGIPVALHEANAIPGKANALLARIARVAATAFPDVAERFPKGLKIADVGMPLRAEFEKGSGTTRADGARFTLLVMGGSQGARSLNEIVVGAIARIAAEHQALFSRLKVVHLAGAKNENSVRDMYGMAGIAGDKVEVIGFSNEMARLYAESDFCISRAGASSCMELALAGLPALFVPLPHLAGDHQTFNAKSMASRGAGEWRAQDGLTTSNLAEFIASVAGDPQMRAKMRSALLDVSRPNAAARFADVIQDLV